MSLYGALFSGVSGLTSQSSAMGAISDNITNVNTIGYKSTDVNFQTLVTKQTSSTLYSAGGVQSKPRQNNDVQGLLQASTSSTDIAISGEGFFVSNAAKNPTGTDQYVYTRAGSFKRDNEGYLRNTAGYYLQAWPTDAQGKIKLPTDSSQSVTNTNVISNDYLETVNLARVSGSASATSKISIGANLPTNATSGTTYQTDAQFFDSLGNANTVSFDYIRSAVDNQWDLAVEPPAGTAALTLYDKDSKVYDSYGQLEFTKVPADGATVTVDGITYEYSTDLNYGGNVAQVDTLTLTDAGAANIEAGDVFELNLNGGTTVTYTVAGGGETLAAVTTGLVNAINNDSGTSAIVTAASSVAGTITITADTPGTAFTTTSTNITTNTGDVDTFTSSTTTANVAATTTRVAITASSSASDAAKALKDAIIAQDTDYDTTNNRVAISSAVSTTVLFHEDGTDNIVIDPSGLLDSSGNPVTRQTASFTVQKQDADYSEVSQFVFPANPADADTIVINGITYEFDSNSSVTETSTLKQVVIGGSVAATLANLETKIEASDAAYAAGSTKVRLRDNNGTGTGTNDTLVLTTIPGKSYNVTFTGTLVGGGASNLESATKTQADLSSGVTVSTKYAINFDSKGLPSSFNVAEIDIKQFENGAADMDDATANAKRIDLDFGTVGESNGMTQFGNEFTPAFISQNGARFGSFAGVTIADDGLVTALFDNGDTRPIFRVPIATFVNANGLDSKTGNVWIATDDSGDYTLREAGTGPAGQITQASLEASTVDIGKEFTSMIVVQRAYSASTKIISTTDEMLEELTRIKR